MMQTCKQRNDQLYKWFWVPVKEKEIQWLITLTLSQCHPFVGCNLKRVIISIALSAINHNRNTFSKCMFEKFLVYERKYLAEGLITHVQEVWFPTDTLWQQPIVFIGPLRICGKRCLENIILKLLTMESRLWR